MPKPKLDVLEVTHQDSQDDYILPRDTGQSDEISLLAINELLSKKKLKTISRLKFDQVSVISRLYLYGDTFKQPFTKKLADLILQLQISTYGLGRKELVQLVQQRNMMEQGQPIKTSKDIFR